MERCNKHVKCDVCECAHNLHGRNCSLETVQISCANGDCSHCESFENKH
ncbi:MAG: DUF1540 domain-containing protein [Clostridia bacterium]|nr:DUF1540 domain-containing protein [Clostridia bacterium]